MGRDPPADPRQINARTVPAPGTGGGGGWEGGRVAATGIDGDAAGGAPPGGRRWRGWGCQWQRQPPVGGAAAVRGMGAVPVCTTVCSGAPRSTRAGRARRRGRDSWPAPISHASLPRCPPITAKRPRTGCHGRGENHFHPRRYVRRSTRGRAPIAIGAQNENVNVRVDATLRASAPLGRNVAPLGRWWGGGGRSRAMAMQALQQEERNIRRARG